MHKNVHIYNELKELNSPLADISNINVYSVPDGYFGSLSSDIQQRLYEQPDMSQFDVPVLEMKVPEGYFDGLADAIMNKIKSNESPVLEEYPAFLAPVQHKNVFKVPFGYFDSLAGDILNKISGQKPRVIEMKPRPAVFRYAIAAGITGILGLSLFSVFDNRSHNEISKPDNNPTAFVEIINDGMDIIKNGSFDKTLEALADDEIVNYLKNDGEDINAALVASVTDEQTLPEQDAYFIDEQTLDNFLIEQHVVQASNN
ncbi:MAG: hypothetical protein ABIN36_12500 [Ferruginibacter sp.]